MSAARLELKDAASGATTELSPIAVMHERPRTSLVALVATAVVSALIAGTAAWVWLRPAPSAPAPVLRASIALPPGTNAPTGENFQGPVAISATHVALVANPGRQLYLRPLSSDTAVPVPGATAVANPFFSPDGQYLAFFSLDDGRLRTVPVAGGPTSDLCAVSAPVGGHWGPGNVIVFADFEKGVFTVPGSGGTPTLVVPGTKDALAMEPSWLPDGRTILYSTATRIGRFDLEIATAKLHAKTIGDPGPGRPILDGYRARFVAPGYLVLVRGTTIVGMPFDAARLLMTGAEQTLVTEVARSGYDLSSSGSIVYAASTLQASRTFVWVDRKGNIEPTGMRALQYAYPRISPDNTRIVVDTRQDERDLWIWDIRQKTMRRLTFEKGQDAYAVWTADSKNIVYAASTAGAEENLTIRPADGTGAVEPLLASPRHQTPYSLSRDGLWLVYRDEVDGEGTNVGLLHLKDRAAKPLLATRFNERNAEISPDGTLIAYQSDEGGGMDIYVRPFPDVNSGKVQVSSSGGIRPAWSRDGRELFFLSGAQEAMVIKSATRRAGALDFTPPVTVLDAGAFYFGAFLGRTYDVGADGRFLLQRVEAKNGTSAPSTISLVMNWVEDLRKK